MIKKAFRHPYSGVEGLPFKLATGPLSVPFWDFPIRSVQRCRSTKPPGEKLGYGR